MNYSYRIARNSRSNFFWSFYFLRKERRDGIMAVYAFSRLVDDAVDEAPDEVSARREVSIWRERIDYIYSVILSEAPQGVAKNPIGSNGSFPPKADPPLAGAAQDDSCFHPLLPELAETIRRFDIPKHYFLDLLVGVEMDLNKTRYQSFGELEKYCYHVAGTIGLLCNRLFGVEGKPAEQYAILLGTAFQLTNILRDVGSDARRGRIYIPLEELKKFSVSESDLFENRLSSGFYHLMNFQADRAQSYYEKAFAMLPDKTRRKIIPSEIMTAFYHSILKRLRDENFPVFERKVGVSARQKLYLIGRILLKASLP